MSTFEQTNISFTRELRKRLWVDNKNITANEINLLIFMINTTNHVKLCQYGDKMLCLYPNPKPNKLNWSIWWSAFQLSNHRIVSAIEQEKPIYLSNTLILFSSLFRNKTRDFISTKLFFYPLNMRIVFFLVFSWLFFDDEQM